jgi:hypothetical protein
VRVDPPERFGRHMKDMLKVLNHYMKIKCCNSFYTFFLFAQYKSTGDIAI